MKVTFSLQYRASLGQYIALRITSPQVQVINMHCLGESTWTATVDLAIGDNLSFINYTYELLENGRVVRGEPGRMLHQVILNPLDEEAEVADSWREKFADSYIYTAAFLKEFSRKGAISAAANSINLRAWSHVPDNSELYVVGSLDSLGGWDLSRALPMTQVAPNYWIISLKKENLSEAFTYKFVALKKDDKGAITEIIWEDSDNHQCGATEIFANGSFNLAEHEVKFSFNRPRLAGTAVPVFALRSEGSFGIGDFGDLKLLIDWAHATSQRVIQILPINDTTITNTWTDSYPYNSISIYAFHPMYVDLRKLGKLKDTKEQKRFDDLQNELNSLPKVDYERVNEAKREFLRLKYDEDGERLLSTPGFKSFFDRNSSWLMPYAAFSTLRDQYGTADFRQWPMNSYDKVQIESVCSPKSKTYHAVAFYYYVQYLLHVQLLEASNYARSLGIILKGDIPIGISRNSVEAWVEPFYFNMDGQAGAPPDAFAKNGQNWGFPTYNWDVMKADDYAWWRKRFKKMAEYFGAYRIDHILGFFRIWEIPEHSVHGLLGQFVPSMPMSVAEIESYGLKFQEDFMTKPFINEELLGRTFGCRVQDVKAEFLVNTHDDIYELKPKFDTQRKVEAYFKDHTDDASAEIREGLYSLISDVLFIRDRKERNLYHPRITVMDDYVFTRLNPQEQEAFRNLYNDYYYRRHNQFWYEKAMEKLPVLVNSTNMLTCGEDLGMVPDCVPWVMSELDILSLEIQRMPKAMGMDFGDPAAYPIQSVCTIGTHDMTTLRGWWREDPELTQKFYNSVLHHEGQAPADASGRICEEVVDAHLASPSLLCILTLQDWMSIDESLRCSDIEGERINIPAIVKYYWRYRMHITLEDLIKDAAFNQHVKNLIAKNNRS